MNRKPLSMPPAYATLGPRPEAGKPITALQQLYVEQCELETAANEQRARKDLQFWLSRLIARALAELTSKE